MTMTKPMTVWCVHMYGRIVLETTAITRANAMSKAEMFYRDSWDNLRKSGFRCRKFRLEPINDN